MKGGEPFKTRTVGRWSIGSHY